MKCTRLKFIYKNRSTGYLQKAKNRISSQCSTIIKCCIKHDWTVWIHSKIYDGTCLPSAHTTIYCTRSKIIHIFNISVPIKLPQTCPPTAGQKFMIIIFSVENLFLCMYCYVVCLIIQAHFHGQPWNWDIQHQVLIVKRGQVLKVITGWTPS